MAPLSTRLKSRKVLTEGFQLRAIKGAYIYSATGGPFPTAPAPSTWFALNNPVSSGRTLYVRRISIYLLSWGATTTALGAGGIPVFALCRGSGNVSGITDDSSAVAKKNSGFLASIAKTLRRQSLGATNINPGDGGTQRIRSSGSTGWGYGHYDRLFNIEQIPEIDDPISLKENETLFWGLDSTVTWPTGLYWIVNCEWDEV